MVTTWTSGVSSGLLCLLLLTHSPAVFLNIWEWVRWKWGSTPWDVGWVELACHFRFWVGLFKAQSHCLSHLGDCLWYHFLFSRVIWSLLGLSCESFRTSFCNLFHVFHSASAKSTACFAWRKITITSSPWINSIDLDRTSGIEFKGITKQKSSLVSNEVSKG